MRTGEQAISCVRGNLAISYLIERKAGGVPKQLRGVRSRTSCPPGVSDLDRLIAHEDIRQLVERYSVAVGARALDVVAELFVEDVVAGPGQRGRQALLAAYEQMLPPGGVTILLVTSHVIDLLAADHAEGIVYCLCETGTEKQWMRQIIAYEDTYTRADGRWFFVSRRHELFYGVDAGPSPLAQEPANWPKRNIGRGSVPFDWPTWRDASP
jgi:SnoaL-like domain